MVGDVEAVRIMLLVAKKNGWRNVKIQLDIKVLAHCFQARKITVVETTIIAEDINLLPMMFEYCKFSFGSKSCNRANSNLAWFGLVKGVTSPKAGKLIYLSG